MTESEQNSDNRKNTNNNAINAESVRTIAESIGISVLLDKPASYLATDVTYRLKIILQECCKFARHSAREKVTASDFNNSLKLKNIEPQYGFTTKEYIPFRLACGGGRQFHFQEEKELDLNDIIGTNLPKIPVDVSLKAHWLAIDGVQPAISENPTPINKAIQQFASMAPGGSTTTTGGENDQKPCEIKIDGNATSEKSIAPLEWMKMHKAKAQIQLREVSSHELSVEQQFYYKEITESCVGSDENKRTEALQSLSLESGLYQMVPRFTTFISEGVRVNVVQHNLALLIYLMRMVKSLLDNTTLYLEKYLHELVPAVTTCLISKQLCVRPESDNHWALRDFASRLLSQICTSFHNSTNNLQPRLTSILSDALTNTRNSLSTHYGAIVGLSELGMSTIKTFILPNVAAQGERIRSAMDGSLLISNNVDKVAAAHIKTAILKVVPPVVKIRQKIDNLDNYTAEFGEYFAKDIYVSVSGIRTTSTTSMVPKLNPVSQMRKSQMYVNQNQQRAFLQTTQQQHAVGGQTTKYVVMSSNVAQGQTVKQQQPAQIFTSSQIVTTLDHGDI